MVSAELTWAAHNDLKIQGILYLYSVHRYGYIVLVVVLLTPKTRDGPELKLNDQVPHAIAR